MTPRAEPEPGSPAAATPSLLARLRARFATRLGLWLLPLAGSALALPWSTPAAPDRAPAVETRGAAVDPPPPSPASATLASPTAVGSGRTPHAPDVAAAGTAPAPPAPVAPLAQGGDEAPAAARLRLRALDAAGARVPFARFEVSGRALDAPLLVEADLHGAADLALPPGAWRVVAFGPAGISPAVAAPLAPGGESRVDLVLVPGHAVTGRIVDARTGEPLAGARVSFWTHAELDAVETGSDGRFRHDRFPGEGGTHQVRVEADGYGPLVRYLRVEPAGPWALVSPTSDAPDTGGSRLPARLELGLHPAASLAGTVVDAAGRPLAGVRVHAEGFAQVLPGVGSADRAEGATGVDGRFVLDGLRSDLRHRLELEAPGFGRLRLAAPRAAGATDLGRLVLSVEATLAGAVFDPEGLPAEGVRVSLRLAPEPGLEAAPEGLDLGWPHRRLELGCRTDAAGTFLFDALPPGAHVLCVQAGGGVLHERALTVAAGDSRGGEVFELPPESLTLTGRVLRGGEPVAGAAVTLRRAGRSRSVTCGPDGRFRAAGLDDDASYRLEVTAALEGRRFAAERPEVWAFERVEVELGEGDWVAAQR